MVSLPPWKKMAVVKSLWGMITRDSCHILQLFTMWNKLITSLFKPLFNWVYPDWTEIEWHSLSYWWNHKWYRKYGMQWMYCTELPPLWTWLCVSAGVENFPQLLWAPTQNLDARTTCVVVQTPVSSLGVTLHASCFLAPSLPGVGEKVQTKAQLSEVQESLQEQEATTATPLMHSACFGCWFIYSFVQINLMVQLLIKNQ